MIFLGYFQSCTPMNFGAGLSGLLRRTLSSSTYLRLTRTPITEVKLELPLSNIKVPCPQNASKDQKLITDAVNKTFEAYGNGKDPMYNLALRYKNELQNPNKK